LLFKVWAFRVTCLPKWHLIFNILSIGWKWKQSLYTKFGYNRITRTEFDSNPVNKLHQTDVARAEYDRPKMVNVVKDSLPNLINHPYLIT
jgi:hypothetical protein